MRGLGVGFVCTVLEVWGFSGIHRTRGDTQII